MLLPRHVHDYLNDYIRLADTKAAAVFVVASGMISIVVSTSPHWNTGHVNIPKAVWFSVAVSINVAAALTSLYIVAPRLGRGTPGRFIYWRDILMFGSVENYVKAATAVTDELAGTHISRHNWELARIANAKYTMLRLAFTLATIGLVVSIPFAAIY